MLDLTLDDVGHCLEPTMWMCGHTDRLSWLGVLGRPLVEEEEWVDPVDDWPGKRTQDLESATLEGADRRHDAFDATDWPSISLAEGAAMVRLSLAAGSITGNWDGSCRLSVEPGVGDAGEFGHAVVPGGEVVLLES